MLTKNEIKVLKEIVFMPVSNRFLSERLGKQRKHIDVIVFNLRKKLSKINLIILTFPIERVCKKGRNPCAYFVAAEQKDAFLTLLNQEEM